MDLIVQISIPARHASFALCAAVALNLSCAPAGLTGNAMPKPTGATQTMDTTTLNRQIASVLPRPDEERWLTIPWRQNLMQARMEAQQYNRPIFMWVMNGNPLGCT